MRIVLADDKPKVRLALRLLLEQELGARVVGEVAGANELLAQLEATYPNLVLLDWGLPGVPAAELLSELRKTSPKTSVIVLSGRPEVEEAALSAGADAFVSKTDPPERLLDTIRTTRRAAAISRLRDPQFESQQPPG